VLYQPKQPLLTRARRAKVRRTPEAGRQPEEPRPAKPTLRHAAASIRMRLPRMSRREHPLERSLPRMPARLLNGRPGVLLRSLQRARTSRTQKVHQRAVLHIRRHQRRRLLRTQRPQNQRAHLIPLRARRRQNLRMRQHRRLSLLQNRSRLMSLRRRLSLNTKPLRNLSMRRHQSLSHNMKVRRNRSLNIKRHRSLRRRSTNRQASRKKSRSVSSVKDSFEFAGPFSLSGLQLFLAVPSSFRSAARILLPCNSREFLTAQRGSNTLFVSPG